MSTVPGLPNGGPVGGPQGYGVAIAQRLRTEHRAIARAWLARLIDLLPIDARDVFPSDALLDHIPALILELSAYLENPSEQAIGANAAVLAKAQELGHLRHTQGASLHQLIQEYRILGEILIAFVRDETILLEPAPSPAESVEVLGRLNECVGVLLQTTVDTFVTAYTETIELQNKRLEAFSRMVSHELRQPLGVLQFGAATLRLPETLAEPAKVERVLTLIDRNVRGIIDLTRKLESMSRLQAQHEGAQRQNVEISSIANDTALQLREMAQARGVEIRVSTDLPVLVADVGRLQLVLMNLVSNGIKYSDPSKAHRFVSVEPADAPSDVTCAFRIRDNGLGMEPEHLGGVFKRFFRAHADRDEELGTEGMGLGLSIVADCVDNMRGTVGVESETGVGTTFSVVLPIGDSEPVLSEPGE